MKNFIKRNKGKVFISLIVIFIVIFIIILIPNISTSSSNKLNYVELVSSIKDGNVKKIQLDSTGKNATITIMEEKINVKIPYLDTFIKFLAENEAKGNHIDITFEEDSNNVYNMIATIFMITIYSLMVLLIILGIKSLNLYIKNEYYISGNKYEEEKD